MAIPAGVLAPDTLTRSVWVVVEPRDAVTGARVSLPLRVGVRNLAARPIQSRSGLYCFTDLHVPAGNYVVEVDPLLEAASAYFPASRAFLLKVPPVSGQPLDRNFVSVELFPRPAYVFDDRVSLARGRLLRASNGAPVEAADIRLILGGADQGRRGRTTESGDFVVFFPPEPPDESPPEPPSPDPKALKFRLEFTVPNRPPHLIAEQTVNEGATLSLGDITFPSL